MPPVTLPPSIPQKRRGTIMTRHDVNRNEELVVFCETVSEKTLYRIQPGLVSAGFYRNRKKRKVLETRPKGHSKENGAGNMYERSVSGMDLYNALVSHSLHHIINPVRFYERLLLNVLPVHPRFLPFSL